MRGSEPMPRRTSSMSAPIASARLASSFMNEMRVASIELAAYLVSSAERTLITMTRSWLRWKGAYSRRSSEIARASSAPTMMRSGRMKSSTAAPSFRNSGFETTANGTLVSDFKSSRILSAVPIGTVDLVATSFHDFMCRAIARAAASTCCRSAEPSSPGGVLTAISCSSPCATLAGTSVENVSRPASRLRFTIGSSPGSKIGTRPAFSKRILSSLTSRQNTVLPASARQAPVTRPTYPVPMTVTFMRVYSWAQIELFRSTRRIGLPAAAGGTLPVELARLEAAALAAVARKASRVAVHEAPHELEVAALVGRAGGDDLGFEQAVEAEERRVAAQLVAHQRVRLLRPLRLQCLLKHGVEQIERRVALEVAGEERQGLLRAPGVAVRLDQALRDEREVRRVLRFDALPVLDGPVEVTRILFQVAPQQARAHAFAVGLERGIEMPPRRIRARLRGFRSGELAQELRQRARVGLDLLGHLDGARPVLLLLIDLEQEAARGHCLASALEPRKELLGAIENARLEVILAKLHLRLQLLLRPEVGAVEEVLMHADRAVVLAAAAEETPEREMQLHGFGVDLDHLDEGFDRLVGLLVQQEVQALEIRARQRARFAHDLLDVDARRHPAQPEEQRKAEQPPVLELHR